MTKNPKLIHKWSTALPADARAAVEVLAALAVRRGTALYLVGGPLRDLLLGRASLDIDFSVEGDAITLATELASALGLRARTHPAFGTATIRGDGWHIDIATARSETYRRPGALPEVTPATIDDDLHRRDFTINAMALRLDGPEAGVLLDSFGGQADLRTGVIRVLHERSFQDDATRVLRAARYESRFGLEIEPETLGWLRRDVSYLGTISGARLHQELSRIFHEETLERSLTRLDEIGAFPVIHSALAFGQGQAKALAWLRTAHPHGLSAACWPLLVLPKTSADAEALAHRLALTSAQALAVQAMAQSGKIAGLLSSPALRISEVVELLAPVPVPALWVLAAIHSGRARQRCVAYLDHARHVKPSLRGDDVIALGVPRGPEVGEVLRRLRVAKLDGEVKTRKDEERLVRSLLAGAPAR